VNGKKLFFAVLTRAPQNNVSGHLAATVIRNLDDGSFLAPDVLSQLLLQCCSCQRFLNPACNRDGWMLFLWPDFVKWAVWLPSLAFGAHGAECRAEESDISDGWLWVRRPRGATARLRGRV